MMLRFAHCRIFWIALVPMCLFVSASAQDVDHQGVDLKGKVHENKDETATRHGAWWGVAAGAAVGVLFPPSVLVSAAAGGVIGGVSGHLAKGMSRSRAKDLGDDDLAKLREHIEANYKVEGDQIGRAHV